MSTPTLTTPDAFRRHLDANPHDFVAMGAYADCLSEQDPAYVECFNCRGEGFLYIGGRGNGDVFFPYRRTECRHCGGAGEIRDDTSARLAEAYRALSVIRPVYDAEQNCWWGWMSHLPTPWWTALAALSDNQRHGECIRADSPIKGLDAAALAWAALLPDLKTHILSTGPWAPK